MKHEITAKRLQLALSNKKITAQELCNISGVSKASVSQYVNGSHKPSNISAQKMGNCLDVNPLWLMGFDVPMKPETITHSVSLFSGPGDLVKDTDMRRAGLYLTNTDGTEQQFDTTSIVYSIIEAVSEMPPEQQEMVNNMVGGKKRDKIIYVENPHNRKPASKDSDKIINGHFTDVQEALAYIQQETSLVAAFNGKTDKADVIIQMANAIYEDRTK